MSEYDKKFDEREANAKLLIMIDSLMRQHLIEPWEMTALLQAELLRLNESLIENMGSAPLPTDYGDWTLNVDRDRTNGSHHDLLVFGDLKNGSLGDGENVLVRLHSSCRTNEVYHASNCECRKELELAMSMIQSAGRGVIVYLDQEGRGNGIVGKLAQLNNMFAFNDEGKIDQRRDPLTGERIDTDRAYKDSGYVSERRNFAVAADMLKNLKIKSVRLMSNNPEKRAGLEAAGIQVKEFVGLHIPPENEIIRADLSSKRVNMGHHIGDEHLIIPKKP